jgi:hypothetical protein
LPAAWSTLEELARAKPKDLAQWIRAGKVHAAMTRPEADCLVNPRPEPQKVIEDPEDIQPGTVIDARDLPLWRRDRSAERSETLKKLAAAGFNMTDLKDEMADIAAGAKGTQTPAPPIDDTWLLRAEIDRCITELEIASVLSFSRDSEFERWALRAAARIRRLLEK